MAEAGFALTKAPARAADGHPQRWHSSTIRKGIACVAPPCSWSSGAPTIVNLLLLHNTCIEIEHYFYCADRYTFRWQ